MEYKTVYKEKTPKKGFGIKFSGNGYLVRMLIFENSRKQDEVLKL